MVDMAAVAIVGGISKIASPPNMMAALIEKENTPCSEPWYYTIDQQSL